MKYAEQSLRKSLDKHGDKKYSELSDKLKDKISRSDFRGLKDKFGNISQSFDQRTPEVDQRFNDRSSAVDNRFGDIDNQFSDMQSQYESNFADMQSQYDTKFADMQSQFTDAQNNFNTIQQQLTDSNNALQAQLMLQKPMPIMAIASLTQRLELWVVLTLMQEPVLLVLQALPLLSEVEVNAAVITIALT